MVDRDRTWLRTFLHLDSRADTLSVPRRDVERQEDTVLRALTLLDQQPGVMLGQPEAMKAKLLRTLRERHGAGKSATCIAAFDDGAEVEHGEQGHPA